MDVDCLAVKYRSTSGSAPDDGSYRRSGWHRPKYRHLLKDITIDSIDHSILSVTKPRGTLCNHVQYWLDIRRRTGDDAENLARRGLLLQCFGEIAIARLLLVNKSRVLNRDHRLIGEGFEQLDLTVGKRADLSSANLNSADGHASVK